MAEIEQRDTPRQIEFECPHCGLSCITFPATRATVHQKPTCAMWLQVMRKQKELLPMFLIRGGVEVVRLNPAGSA